ncbi:MAG: hypothetical protein JO331_15920 [Verrucomicrobia bacterium]|nr:hypothetical protein [Verrucomicrobiota bacterium]
MTRFRKVFLRDSLNRSTHLAGFGKHPAWDDHIDDLGLTTETLVIVRRILYSEGIASQVSSGAWSRLEGNGQALVFDHRFVWSRDAQSVVGGIWASSDGKGRAHFPMIVCLQIGMNGRHAIRSFLAPVEDLGGLCKKASGQQEFRDAFMKTEHKLASNTRPDSESGFQFFNLTEEREQEITNGMIALSEGLGKHRREGARRGAGSAHIRLPAISSRPKENLEFWIGYVETQLDFHLPCLAIASTSPGPIDIIAGEPEADDFFCLRAAETRLPLTSTGDERPADVRLQAKVYLRSYGLESF